MGRGKVIHPGITAWPKHRQRKNSRILTLGSLACNLNWMNNRPSESTERLIESLYAKKALWDRLVQPAHPEEIIRLIEEAGEPAAIPDLLPILIIGDRKAILASARAIHHLLQTLEPADFARFDEFVRQGYSDWHERRKPWYSMKPEDIGHLASIGDISASLLGIASSHV